MSKKPPSSDRIILKILSGTQAGAEVALEPGDYTLGAGPDDDIQLVDISLTPGHAKLRISATKVEILGGNGSLVSATGMPFPANGETWSELEPLEIVTAGTTRFALGPVHANWTTLSEAAIATLARPKADDKPASGWRGGVRQVHRYANFGIMAVLVLILIAVVYQQWNIGALVPRSAGPGSVAALKNALSALPFANAVTVREDVDGTIYATGLVETAVDRRAVAAAAEKLSIPLRLRLNVRQTMRTEIESMIASMKLPVVADLAPDGVLRLEGLILKDDVARQFVERLKTDVSGIGQIENHIRTAKTLIGEIEKLAKKAQIDGYVVFRLDNQSVEVNGILPVEKIDAWVGFIQAYSKNFAKDIALRSYVQLQAGGNEAVQPLTGGPAIAIGPQERNSTDITLDMDRIRRGLYELSDLFVGLKRKQPAGPDPAAATSTPPAPEAKPAVRDAVAETPSRDDWQLGGPSQPMRDANAKPTGETAPGALFGTTAYAGETPKSGDRLPAGLGLNGVNPGAPSVPASPAGATAGVPPLNRQTATPSAVPAAGNPSLSAQPSAAGTVTPGAAASTAIEKPALLDQLPVSTADNSSKQIALAEPDKGIGAAPPRDVQPDSRQPPASASSGKARVQPVAATPTAPSALTDAANKLINRWLSGLTGKAELPAPIQATLDRIAETRATIAPRETSEPEARPRYLPLIATDLPGSAAREACWAGSRLTSGNLPTALFWLDVLSQTQQLSLKTFTLEEQRFLLEAASNPRRVRQCMAEKGGDTKIALTSLYLNEANQNPDFIRFVVRDLATTDIDIAGINLSQDRFLQTRDGVKHREGTTLDISRRILAVGELAAIIRTNEGFSVIPYGGEVNWVLTSR